MEEYRLLALALTAAALVAANAAVVLVRCRLWLLHRRLLTAVDRAHGLLAEKFERPPRAAS